MSKCCICCGRELLPNTLTEPYCFECYAKISGEQHGLVGTVVYSPVKKDFNNIYLPCLICGEKVLIHTAQQSVIVCDNCKEAVLRIRELLKDFDE